MASEFFSGNVSCPCLDATTVATLLAGTTTVSIGGQLYPYGDAVGAVYTSDYGVGCRSWDVRKVPFCVPKYCGPPINGECMPQWCAEPWCWVNVSLCASVGFPMWASNYMTGKVSYSYETCGGTDVFGTFYQAVMAPKTPPPSQPPPSPPPTPPPSPPATPPSAPPYFYTVEIANGAIWGALLLLCLAGAILWFVRKSNALQRKQQRDAEEQGRSALRMVHDMNFTAAFVRASDFVEMGELQNYETLRNTGKLVFRDRFSDLADGDDFTIFISHQWTSFGLPDPSVEQYPVMCAAVRKIAAEKASDVLGKAQAKAKVQEGTRRDATSSGSTDATSGSTPSHPLASSSSSATQSVNQQQQLILEKMLVWVDYSSIPQVSAGVTKLAIQSLSAYSSLATEFVIVAPPVVHLDTQKTCDFATYRRRAWCRAEQLCHLFRNGMDDMWLATSVERIERLHACQADNPLAPWPARPAAAASRLKRAATAVKMSNTALASMRVEPVAEVRRPMTEQDWLNESVRVFQGDITKEMDKIALVQPLLGLYAELYAVCKEDSKREERAVPFAHSVMELIQTARGEILPRAMVRSEAATRSSRLRLLEQVLEGSRCSSTSFRSSRRQPPEARMQVASASGADFSSPTLSKESAPSRQTHASRRVVADANPAHAYAPSDAPPATPPKSGHVTADEGGSRQCRGAGGGRGGEQVELFGILVETVEQIIDSESELREVLYESFLKRRGMVAERHRKLMRGLTTVLDVR
jgi:hypothetical protein